MNRFAARAQLRSAAVTRECGVTVDVRLVHMDGRHVRVERDNYQAHSGERTGITAALFARVSVPASSATEQHAARRRLRPNGQGVDSSLAHFDGARLEDAGRAATAASLQADNICHVHASENGASVKLPALWLKVVGRGMSGERQVLLLLREDLWTGRRDAVDAEAADGEVVAVADVSADGAHVSACR